MKTEASPEHSRNAIVCLPLMLLFFLSGCHKPQHKLDMLATDLGVVVRAYLDGVTSRDGVLRNLPPDKNMELLAKADPSIGKCSPAVLKRLTECSVTLRVVPSVIDRRLNALPPNAPILEAHREGRLLWRYRADGFIQRRPGAE
ncbi:MAG: hypothetical protein U0S12_01080 [Fimbriimonadales bacterium]